MSDEKNLESTNNSRRPRRRKNNSTGAPVKGQGRRGNRRGRRPAAPKAVLEAVNARYGNLVKVVAPRERGGFRIKVKDAPSAVTAAMWVEEDGIVRFDSTAPGVRRRELAAAARLEEKGFTIKAEQIRARVAPELLVDDIAVKTVIGATRTLAAVREVVSAAGIKSVWHRHVERGDEYGPLSLEVGKGVRVRAGVDAEEQPWFAVDRGDTRGATTKHLSEVLAQIS